MSKLFESLIKCDTYQLTNLIQHQPYLFQPNIYPQTLPDLPIIYQIIICSTLFTTSQLHRLLECLRPILSQQLNIKLESNMRLCFYLNASGSPACCEYRNLQNQSIRLLFIVDQLKPLNVLNLLQSNVKSLIKSPSHQLKMLDCYNQVEDYLYAIQLSKTMNQPLTKVVDSYRPKIEPDQASEMCDVSLDLLP